MTRLIGIFVLLAASAAAQSPITFQYFYDETGQLIRVVDSTGITIEYVYDAVGNMLKIKRSTLPSPGTLRIFSVMPSSGGALAVITIQGQGFGLTPATNIVRFGTATATVVSATATTLVVQGPANATSGPISVSVGGPPVLSPAPFIYLPLPVVLSVLPNSALNATTPAITVTGVNLSGSSFGFLPVFVPPVVTVTSALINAAGTSAVLQVTVAAAAAGSFTLVATNSAGSSSAFPAPGNVLNVYNLPPSTDDDGDGLTNADEITRGTDPSNPDTDGDTWPDGLEVALNANPLDPNSIPNPNRSGWISSPLISLLNNANPSTSTGTKYVSSLTFSMLNNLNPSSGVPGTSQYVSSWSFSMLNSLNPSTGVIGTTSMFPAWRSLYLTR